jgi:three-Cys-motif partner protein
MPKKDLHDDPFDQTTIAKLEIFEDYAQAWLPTFVMNGVHTLCIFDFFAGTGYDKNGIEGSPIRILKKIKEQIGNIFQKGVKVKLYFNEWEPNKKEQLKFGMLQKACEEFLYSNADVKRAIELQLLNEDFETLFPKLLSTIRGFPSLVYLDQNGIKFLSDKYLLELENTTQTDFIYFVSASYFWRFGDKKEFKMHLDIDMADAKKDPYRLIHRNIIEQLRKKLPPQTNLKLYPFSLKKGANIYGIIFGASHVRAVDKFLSLAWNRNKDNGQANFDIDEDSKKIQPDLFEGIKMKKIESFKSLLRSEVLSKRLTTNAEVLNFTYREGHIPRHAADTLKQMKSDRLIDYEGSSPMITYENVYKLKRIIQYKIN